MATQTAVVANGTDPQAERERLAGESISRADTEARAKRVRKTAARAAQISALRSLPHAIPLPSLSEARTGPIMGLTPSEKQRDLAGDGIMIDGCPWPISDKLWNRSMSILADFHVGLLRPPLVNERDGKLYVYDGLGSATAAAILGYTEITYMVVQVPVGEERYMFASQDDNVKKVPALDKFLNMLDTKGVASADERREFGETLVRVAGKHGFRVSSAMRPNEVKAIDSVFRVWSESAQKELVLDGMFNLNRQLFNDLPSNTNSGFLAAMGKVVREYGDRIFEGACWGDDTVRPEVLQTAIEKNRATPAQIVNVGAREKRGDRGGSHVHVTPIAVELRRQLGLRKHPAKF